MNIEDLYRLLRSSHVQSQGIVDTIDEPLVVLDQHAYVVEANRAFFGTFLVERDDTIGVPLRKLGNGQWDIPALTTLISEVIPKAAAVVDYEVRHDFPGLGERTFLLTARRMWKPDDNSTQVVLVFTDVTGNREKERESNLILSELRHRMGNLLAVVHAIANQTETTGKTADEYKATFMGRFGAILQSQKFLSSGNATADLRSLISAVVGGLGGERLHISGGPTVLIDEMQIVPLTTILHELGTNALKYGGFSDDAGTVDVSWQVASGEGGRSLRLSWREVCPFRVTQPERTGKGTQLVHISAAHSLKGTAELNYGTTGLTANLVFPLIGNG